MIEFDAVSKHYGSHPVIDRLSLTIERGELFVLVGPSGSGKSTLLRMINRLIECDAGVLRIDGRDVREQPPEQLRRGIGYAIQSAGLFPHWTVAQNIATVPHLLGWARPRIDARVAEMMATLQLDPTLANRRPHRLSGGQQQRVGVARALAGDPAIVLMDEPFGALDPPTREALQSSLKQIQRETAKTMVFVTHDMDEALRLGDRIALLENGRLRQCATPRTLLTAPRDERVRAFVDGSGGGLRRLSVRLVRDAMQAEPLEQGIAIHAEASLQEALARMLEYHVEQLAVHDGEGRPLGRLSLGDLIRSNDD